MNQRILDQLNGLLDEERSALLTGDFERIAELLKKKEFLLDMASTDLHRTNVDVPIIIKLRRNLSLYDEALAGLRAVADRIGATSKIRAELRFYGQDGHTISIKTRVQKALEKRA